MTNPVITNLPTKKTWILVVLSLFTYFVYPAHYVKKLSARLNGESSEAPEISNVLVWMLMVTSYLSLALFFGFLAVDDDHPIVKISAIADKVNGLLFLVWSFSARSRIHALLKAIKGSAYWFHGFWTFFFQVFYLNYKLAKLKNEEILSITYPAVNS